MCSDAPIVLLTGASGLVGGELLRQLLPAKPDHVFLLPTRAARKATTFARLPRVQVLECNISAAALEPWRERVVQIVHCAADTRFGLTIDESRAGNVGLTSRLLDYARRCPRLRQFAHVSTVYVAGRSTGMIPEEPSCHQSGFCNTYQQAKYEAEQLVVDVMRSLPASIYRLSSIVGTAEGVVTQINYVHQLLRLLPRNVFDKAPVIPAAPVDLICTDWVAAALAHLLEEAFAPGNIYQVCAGGDASMTAGELFELARSAYHDAGVAVPRMPEFVSLTEYEEYVKDLKRRNDRLLNELIRVTGYSLPHLGLYQAFENRNTMTALYGSGIALPDIRDSFLRSMRYCIKNDWLRGSKRESHSN